MSRTAQEGHEVPDKARLVSLIKTCSPQELLEYIDAIMVISPGTADAYRIVTLMLLGCTNEVPDLWKDDQA